MFPANAARWRVQPVIQPLAMSLHSPKNELQSAHETTSGCKIRLRQSSCNKQPQYPTYKKARSKSDRVGGRTVAGLRVMFIEAILPFALISGRVVSQELPTGSFTASACKWHLLLQLLGYVLPRKLSACIKFNSKNPLL